ncbi:uncharacterized protein LOC135847090 [Planococcus citri]|uniref:uncharacterized protein LOC135847090 n=1 Tax=Planococcus citri TaxID=170843 RepID=UPI0031F8CA5B
MEVPKMGDEVTIPFDMLTYLAATNVIPEPPSHVKGKKRKLYRFIIERYNSDDGTIQAGLLEPLFHYKIVLSYNYFSSAQLIIKTPKNTRSQSKKRMPNCNVAFAAQNPEVSESGILLHDPTQMQQNMENPLGEGVPQILTSFTLPELENDSRPPPNTNAPFSFNLPENSSGQVLKMAISLAQSKVLHYENLANNARNQLARLKERHSEDDPDDMIGTMKEIQIKELTEKYSKKMLDIFNDEPVMSYEFRNIKDDKYPALDFTMVQRLPLIITFDKNAEYEQAFEEYMKGTTIFNLLDGRRVYGSLKVPIWESSSKSADKPATLKGTESVTRFALPFKNSAVLMYACRGFSCRFYRPNRRIVRQHEIDTGHFIEQEKGPQKESPSKNNNELVVSTNKGEVKHEYRYSSDDSVVETEVTHAREITVTKNRRRFRKRESEYTESPQQQEIKREERRRSSSEDSLIEVGVYQLDKRGRKRPYVKTKVSTNGPKQETKTEQYSSDDSVIEVGITRPDENGP